jgi:outer membrane protein assembly factor BamD
VRLDFPTPPFPTTNWSGTSINAGERARHLPHRQSPDTPTRHTPKEAARRRAVYRAAGGGYLLPMPSIRTFLALAPAACAAARASSTASCLAALAAAAVFASGCGAPAMLPEEVLFREASLALEDESYSTAIDNYKKLLEEYPFSDKAEVASLNIAYAHYLKEEYGEAIAAFNDFERLYPVSPLLPFVSYTIGMCWLDQAKAGDRDASASDEALRQFRKVASEFPRTIYADLATFRQTQARENLAAHEIVVGDYYRERKQYTAAAGRYRYILKQYPTTENAQRAAARLKELDSEASEEADRTNAAETAGAVNAEKDAEKAKEAGITEEERARQRAIQTEAEAARTVGNQ